MESESPDDRPVSPKKKFRPSSTSNSEISVKTDSPSLVDSDTGSDSSTPPVNGLAPTRSGRSLSSNVQSASVTTQEESSPQINSQRSTSNIQEEIVSSSENSVCRKQLPASYKEGDADSVTNAEPDEISLSNEATEKKDV